MKQVEARGALVQLVFRKIFVFLCIIFSSLSLSIADENSEILNNVEKYLNDIKYFKANFIQDNKDNSELSEGVFYLSRPGKLRIDYLNPFEASLYTNNQTTTYYDKELDEITTIKTSKTPLHFLLNENITFKDNSFKIVDIENEKENVMISFIENKKEDQGKLILNFKKNPLILSSIKLITEDKQEIEMSLFDISNLPIKNSTFNFINPRMKSKVNK